jgi:hypothetical protein
MNIPEFQEKFGKQWADFTEKPIFRALLDVIDEHSLARQASIRPDGDAAVAAAMFYWQSQGWEKLRKFLKTDLSVKPPVQVSDPDYTEPQTP